MLLMMQTSPSEAQTCPPVRGTISQHSSNSDWMPFLISAT